ncbi:hypothetical protein RY26_09135 [Pseudomonas fluorescens]|nr:hypothetical protein RY26_09135 [Pseudomonas fluorescens]
MRHVGAFGNKLVRGWKQDLIVPTLCVVTPPWTLRVRFDGGDAERDGMHSHAERGNDQWEG